LAEICCQTARDSEFRRRAHGFCGQRLRTSSGKADFARAPELPAIDGNHVKLSCRPDAPAAGASRVRWLSNRVKPTQALARSKSADARIVRTSSGSGLRMLSLLSAKSATHRLWKRSTRRRSGAGYPFGVPSCDHHRH
jgi:hypothetical protein